METADILVVGTGAAGLFNALQLPEKYKVLVITKSEADQADSFLAQGGMCMLLDDDDYDSYFEDTMKAGHYENNKESVDIMIRSSQHIAQERLITAWTFSAMRTEILNSPVRAHIPRTAFCSTRI